MIKFFKFYILFIFILNIYIIIILIVINTLIKYFNLIIKKRHLNYYNFIIYFDFLKNIIDFQ
jgi:hypothetical protein